MRPARWGAQGQSISVSSRCRPASVVRGTKFAAGQEVRAIELRTDQIGLPLMPTIHSAEEAEELVKVLDANYGHSIEPMIRGILSLVAKSHWPSRRFGERHRRYPVRSTVLPCRTSCVESSTLDFAWLRLDLFLKFVLQNDEAKSRISA